MKQIEKDTVWHHSRQTLVERLSGPARQSTGLLRALPSSGHIHAAAGPDEVGPLPPSGETADRGSV